MSKAVITWPDWNSEYWTVKQTFSQCLIMGVNAQVAQGIFRHGSNMHTPGFAAWLPGT